MHCIMLRVNAVMPKMMLSHISESENEVCGDDDIPANKSQY